MHAHIIMLVTPNMRRNTYPYIRENSIRMYTKVDIWHNNIQ